ncbi:MAG: hypothetical protein FJW43_03420 [Actinobacteria bacterium]|nr:hypothetical protein [Actinomycetota bacterium]
MTRRKILAMSIAVLAGCSTLNLGGDGESDMLSGVGRIPGYDFGTAITLPEGFEIDLPEVEGGLIGPKAGGSRLLMIGDSILASTSSRYGNEMCNALKPLGWQVAIEAEASRFAEFGNRVLDQRLKAEAGWDAAVIFLGTNYEGNKDSYAKQLRKMLTKLSPRPVLLVTTSMFRNSQREVNAAIRVVAGEYENASILDWETISETKGVLNPDGVHLSPKGRSVFAVAMARALDLAPYREGECLESKFRDDSSAGKDVMPSPVDPSVDSTEAPAP